MPAKFQRLAILIQSFETGGVWCLRQIGAIVLSSQNLSGICSSRNLDLSRGEILEKSGRFLAFEMF